MSSKVTSHLVIFQDPSQTSKLKAQSSNKKNVFQGHVSLSNLSRSFTDIKIEHTSRVFKTNPFKIFQKFQESSKPNLPSHSFVFEDFNHLLSNFLKLLELQMNSIVSSHPVKLINWAQRTLLMTYLINLAGSVEKHKEGPPPLPIILQVWWGWICYHGAAHMSYFSFTFGPTFCFPEAWTKNFR